MFSTEVWLTPLILLPGVALLIVSTSARFGVMNSTFHRLLREPDGRQQIASRRLFARSEYYRDALVGLYASVALFAAGSLLGGVVNLWRPDSLWIVGGLTIMGIVCIVWAAVQLLREALLSQRVLRGLKEQHETS